MLYFFFKRKTLDFFSKEKRLIFFQKKNLSFLISSSHLWKGCKQNFRTISRQYSAQGTLVVSDEVDLVLVSKRGCQDVEESVTSLRKVTGGCDSEGDELMTKFGDSVVVFRNFCFSCFASFNTDGSRCICWRCRLDDRDVGSDVGTTLEVEGDVRTVELSRLIDVEVGFDSRTDGILVCDVAQRILV